MRKRALVTTAAVVGLGLAAFRRGIRPWYLHWGATAAEVAAPMPLDERVPHPMLASTMAITIEARPDQIWPWLAQMGEPPRAGYYSYTSIERMVGLRVENSDRLLPEHQTLTVGQAIDKNGTMVVQAVEPGRLLVLGPPPEVEGMAAVWSFLLEPIDERSTRLITRVRGDWSPGKVLKGAPPYAWPFLLLMEPGAFIMERKMLLEIKRLAEGSLPEAPRDDRERRTAGLASLEASSVRRYVSLAAAGALHLRRDRVGQRFAIDRGGEYAIFRETVCNAATADHPVVLVVGFRLRAAGSLAPAHWLFQRVCLLTTPFWSGYPGFRVKLWMVDPRTKGYLGIYEWDGAERAQTYADALIRILRPLSTPVSVWNELHPDQSLEPFLAARHVATASGMRVAPSSAMPVGHSPAA